MHGIHSMSQTHIIFLNNMEPLECFCKSICYLFCVHNEVHFVVTTVYLKVLVSVSKLPHECAIL